MRHAMRWWVGGVGLFCVGCLMPADDGFRARVASGCRTVAECTDLERDAHNRYAHCSASGRRNGCDEALTDRQEARRLLSEARGRDATDKNSKIDQHRAEYNATARERQRLHDVIKQLTGRCDDADRVSSALASPAEKVPVSDRESLASDLKDRATKRRQDHVAHVEAHVRHRMQKRDLEGIDDLSKVSSEVDDVKKEVASLKCERGPDDSATLRANVDQWAADVAKQIAAEETCRKSPECLGARLAKPLCETIEERRQLEKDLARERANPAGVVNLNYLHQLGSAMQDADRKIADLKKDYAVTTKRPFSDAACKKK